MLASTVCRREHLCTERAHASVQSVGALTTGALYVCRGDLGRIRKDIDKTCECRYDGWVTELKDQNKVTNLKDAAGIDNLLYSSDVDFSCFADLAVVSPQDYRKEGQGSLMQVRVASGSLHR